MSFFDFTEQVLTSTEKPMWPAKTVVEFVCLDFNEDVQSGDLKLSCKVLNTNHADRFYTHYISNRDHEVAQKIRAQFALAFWTREELIAKTAKPVKLVNRKFSAVAAAPREYNDKTYQSFGYFKDLGMYDGAEPAETLPVDADGIPAF